MSDLPPRPPLMPPGSRDVRGSVRTHRRRRRLIGISVLPTLLTLGNLVCGFAAIHFASKPIGPTAVFGWSTLTIAGALVFLGMLFDGIDGLAARLTRSASEFGAQLDSMADMVTFGVAPAYMMLRLVGFYYGGPENYTGVLGPDADSVYGKVIWGIAAFYICCTALRLARFNVETVSHAEEDHRNFRGLPSPGAAGAVASLIILHQHLWVTKFNEVAPPGFGATSSLAIPIVTMFCSAAMVSRLRYAHIINRYLRGKRSFAYVAWIVAPIVLAIWWFQITLAVLFTVYLLSGPVLTLMLRGKSRQGQAPSGQVPGAAGARAQPPAP